MEQFVPLHAVRSAITAIAELLVIAYLRKGLDGGKFNMASVCFDQRWLCWFLLNRLILQRITRSVVLFCCTFLKVYSSNRSYISYKWWIHGHRWPGFVGAVRLL